MPSRPDHPPPLPHQAERAAAPLPAPRICKLAGVFLGLTLIVPLIAFIIVRLHAPQMQAEALANLRAVATLKAGQIENWLAERRGDTEVLAASDDFALHVERLVQSRNAGQRAQVVKRLELVKKAWNFDSAMLLNAAGQVVVSANGQADIPDLVKHQLFSAAMKSGHAQRSDLYRDASGHARLAYVVPLPGSGGNPQKRVAAVVLLAPVERFLFPLIQTWPTPSPSAETLLVRRDGNSVLYLNELRHRHGTELSLRLPLDSPNIPAVAAVLDDLAHSMEGVDYRGVAVFAATLPVAGTPWHLVAKIDREEVMAPLNTLIFWVSLVAFIAVAAIAAAMLLLWRQMLRAHQLDLAVQATAILRESEARYRSLFENMLEGFAYCRMLFEQGEPQDFIYLEVNGAFENLTGLKNVAGKKVSAVIPGIRESNPELFLIYGRVALSGRPERFETYVEPLGIWFSISVYSPGKEHFVAVFDNITERKQAEAQIRQLNAELEQRVVARTAQLQAANTDLESFSYSVSHDLRAPLRAIDGFSAILREDYAAQLDQEGRRLLQVVSDNARKMGQLIDDILAFSRAGRHELQLAALDMAALAQEAWRELEPQRAGRAIEFRLADMPAAGGDPSAIRQVWLNLLANAIKFSRGREPAVIEAGGATGSGENVYHVRDNGAGFDMAYADKLFGMFQRLHGMDEFEGTGVGLAIVKRFITKHGGRVWAQGRPGEGATFYFALPAAKPEAGD